MLDRNLSDAEIPKHMTRPFKISSWRRLKSWNM